MLRTLRTKLILLTLLAIVSVRLLSTTLALHLSQEVLANRVQEDATLLSQEVAFHAGTILRLAGHKALDREIKSLERKHQNVAAIEIFFFDSAETKVISSRPEMSVTPLTSEERRAVQEGHPLLSLASLGGEPFVNVLTPFREGGVVVGGVRVWASLADIEKLKAEEQHRTVLFAVASGAGVFLLLSFFLNRQINRPLNRLVAAMNAAEAGNLETRVDLTSQDEISQLGQHFNLMLARIGETNAENRELVARLSRFNEELEVRVAQVTRELAERNEELLRLQREMGRVEPLAALERITGTIAHELGTPLNSVLGYAQLLLQEELSESAQRRLKIIESQIQRMVDTIQYYLSLTRGALRRQQQVNVNELVRETLVLLEPFFHQHRVQVSTTLVEPLPPLKADSASLQRLLINLLNNAVDAMAKGGTVAVVTRVATLPEAVRQGIFLEVTDNGSGIPADLLPKVFDLFVTTKTPSKGTGLGLAICQEIVKAHGGIIEVTSRMGEGTCVRIFLPADERGG